MSHHLLSKEGSDLAEREEDTLEGAAGMARAHHLRLAARDGDDLPRVTRAGRHASPRVVRRGGHLWLVGREGDDLPTK